MIYLTNFFVRRIEAVSRQVEDSRESKKDPIISCCYFLGQKPLRFVDIHDNIWIFPQALYPLVAFLIIIFSRSDIHIFEDEPSVWRAFSLNFRKRSIFVTLFKDINPTLIRYLNRIRYIKAIVVEDEESKKIVNKYINKKDIPILLRYPSSIWKPDYKNKMADGRKHLIFASWNGGDKKSLMVRGIVDLLKIVQKTSSTCTIVLRDKDTADLESFIQKMNLADRVKLFTPRNFDDLKREFEVASYVVLIPRKPLMKYVPNSIIDGLSLGKPCIITGCLRFSKTVSSEKLGLLFNHHNIKTFNLANDSEYKKLRINSINWGRANIRYPYSKSIKGIYCL